MGFFSSIVQDSRRALIGPAGMAPSPSGVAEASRQPHTDPRRGSEPTPGPEQAADERAVAVNAAMTAEVRPPAQRGQIAPSGFSAHPVSGDDHRGDGQPRIAPERSANAMSASELATPVTAAVLRPESNPAGPGPESNSLPETQLPGTPNASPRVENALATNPSVAVRMAPQPPFESSPTGRAPESHPAEPVDLAAALERAFTGGRPFKTGSAVAHAVVTTEGHQGRGNANEVANAAMQSVQGALQSYVHNSASGLAAKGDAPGVDGPRKAAPPRVHVGQVHVQIQLPAKPTGNRRQTVTPDGFDRNFVKGL